MSELDDIFDGIAHRVPDEGRAGSSVRKAAGGKGADGVHKAKGGRGGNSVRNAEGAKGADSVRKTKRSRDGDSVRAAKRARAIPALAGAAPDTAPDAAVAAPRPPVVVHDALRPLVRTARQPPPPRDADDAAFVDSRGANARKRTEDGCRIFTVQELKLDEGGVQASELVPGDSDGAVRADIADRYLTPQWRMDQSALALSQEQWARARRFEELLVMDPAPRATALQFIRSGLGGHVIGYRERIADTRADTMRGGASLSMSLQRPMRDARSFVRGAAGSTPFLPGGLDEEALETLAGGAGGKAGAGADGDPLADSRADTHAEDAWSKPGALRSVPPGFRRGLVRQSAASPVATDATDDASLGAPLAVRALAADEHAVITAAEDGLYRMPDAAPAAQREDAVVDEFLPAELVPHMFHGVAAPKREAKREWAHVVGTSKQMTNFHELVPYMAHDYPFELDTFQKQAVYHLERSESVFVAAHTSAGKTVVAEYAIALAQKHLTRCIYTSPIKALSNQKFREFKHSFGTENVGILTGDVQINPEAPCLIMTTEILRSMLYRGADLIRDVEFVIFDEVHYVNDQERGVVWEEVIILLPAHVTIVLLSATVPNTKEFADWVGRTKKKDVYVISTAKRPVPLEHFVYADKRLHKILDAGGRFIASGVHDAAEVLQSKQAAAGTGGRGGGPGGGGRGGRRGAPMRGGAPMRSGAPRAGLATDRSLWVHLVGVLKKQALLPVVVFVFSKRRCEEYANSIPNTDLCTSSEKSEVHVVIERSLARLKESDQRLPQLVRMRALLSRGIGVHHGGLLPIVKELVEILFQRGLVKVLFATETFAMGVNMPARSVVFSGVRKHDGRDFRTLLPGEYTQMSGRAGRRGLDATGVVIIVPSDEPVDVALYNRLLLWQSTKLQSQFRITYSMILNLLRVEALKVEDMIKRSFSENAAQRLLPQQQQKLRAVEAKLAAGEPELGSCTIPVAALAALYDASHDAARLNETLLTLAYHNSQGSKCLGAGRVVVLRDAYFDMAPAFIVRPVPGEHFLVLGAVPPAQRQMRGVKADAVTPMWFSAHTAAQWRAPDIVGELREVPLASIALVTAAVEHIPAASIHSRRPSAMRRAVELLRPHVAHMHAVLAAGGAHAATAALALEVDWARLRRLDFQEAKKARDDVVRTLPDLQGPIGAPDFPREYQVMHRRKLLEREARRISVSLSDQNLELLPDYEQRVAVLKALRFIDPESETVLLKGRVACELKTVNELILTELILDNVFVEYEPAEIAALLSVFLFRDKTAIEPVLSQRLREGYHRIIETADRVAAVQTAHQLSAEDDASTLKTGLMGIVYEWACGTQFQDIMQHTDVGEGTIVRCITRLDETFREVRDAARVIGDTELFQKMELCQQLVRGAKW
ncbi:Antiviral helicase ski2 [Malassezia sp. CBS 17886]|nr:Antiviral helicase ski2 [Malassezia sp. CBS 17886]